MRIRHLRPHLLASKAKVHIHLYMYICIYNTYLWGKLHWLRRLFAGSKARGDMGNVTEPFSAAVVYRLLYRSLYTGPHVSSVVYQILFIGSYIPGVETFPNAVPLARQKALAVSSPPIVDNVYVISVCKFVE